MFDLQMKINKVKTLAVVVFVFFLVWGIFDIIIWNRDYIADRFMIAGFVLIGFLLRKKMNISLPYAVVALVPIALHTIKLYGNTYWGIPYDHIVHFSAGLALSLLFYNYQLHVDKKRSFRIFFFSILIAAGLGSMLEIMEFLGYAIGGEGGGLIFYGAGDIGEWNNAARDMICNIVGATIGALFRTKSFN